MQINQPAPDFELVDLAGNIHKLSDYRGQIVIVNFWSVECSHSERTDRLIMAYLEQRGEGVKLLPIAKDATSAPVEPSEANVHDNSYPISRFLFWYVAGEPTGAVKEFADWVLSADGQKVISEVGYYPLKTAAQ